MKDRQTREPFNTYVDKVSGTSLLVDRIAAEMMKKSVFIQAWVNHFVIAPPLIITKEEIDLGLDALDQTLGIADDAARS